MVAYDGKPFTKELLLSDNIVNMNLINFAGDNTQIGEQLVIPFTWNYLTVSAKGSYTDFQIGFGGSCIWISIIFGKKTRWLIPPTDYNISVYELYLKDSSVQFDYMLTIF
ncbi:Hypothetical protein SRAE_X000225200 [Strongyloides ratti]|uniref:Uncharacterized protein n=1 Tax=Strongyloides ratti TaxID=34506 RepID=A0A090KZ50_STRRB|nr:Hypothetical protein SRAE_X000225200 [Strongyloides ratti]CEF60514.1 Hypothetical protein SRAE_X000225200 [Strongyloides ratti]